MELKSLGEALGKLAGRERLVKLVCLLGVCGIALLFLSSWLEGRKEPSQPQQETEWDGETSRRQLEEDLARVVRAITGEEDPEVLVTLEDTGENVYAADQAWNTQEGGAQNSREEESTYILLKDRDGGQSALPVTQRQPEVRGVVIVSSRAGDPAVREQLTQAAVTALDISSARVLVTSGG